MGRLYLIKYNDRTTISYKVIDSNLVYISNLDFKFVYML